MSEHGYSASSSSPHMLPATVKDAPPLLRVGGALGIAGCSIGFLILFATCAGFSFALAFSFLPMVMGIVGFILSIVGGVMGNHAEGPHVAAGLFINLASVAGGAMEWWAWHHWPKTS